ncbi:MAG: TetR/AcrR family transcriptional regulator, partial [Thermoleophilia bacterium]
MSSIIELSTTLLAASAPIRNEPVQARSTARLAALLDSAAAVIDEIGYERLTTAMVADRAGASIGTVYRYFPDRIAVLQALAARNSERLLERLVGELASDAHATATDAVLGVL